MIKVINTKRKIECKDCGVDLEFENTDLSKEKLKAFELDYMHYYFIYPVCKSKVSVSNKVIIE